MSWINLMHTPKQHIEKKIEYVHEQMHLDDYIGIGAADEQTIKRLYNAKEKAYK